jgi:hypothetical protein
LGDDSEVAPENWTGGGRLKDIRAFIDHLDGDDLHAERVDSLAAATLGVMTGASLAVAMIGQALVEARGLVKKSQRTSALAGRPQSAAYAGAQLGHESSFVYEMAPIREKLNFATQ